jgi:hypothetical protein
VQAERSAGSPTEILEELAKRKTPGAEAVGHISIEFGVTGTNEHVVTAKALLPPSSELP